MISVFVHYELLIGKWLFSLNAVLFSSVITKQIFMYNDSFLQKALEKDLFQEPVKQRVFDFLSIVHKCCVGM